MSSPLWTFSHAVHGADGVEGECLDLQDRFGLDVNLILFCAFVGALRGIALTADDIEAARRQVGARHEGVVQPLRAQAKMAELESERIEQSMLEGWAGTNLAKRPGTDVRAAVPENLKTLLAVYGVGPERPDPMQATRHIVTAPLDRAPQFGG